MPRRERTSSIPRPMRHAPIYASRPSQRERQLAGVASGTGEVDGTVNVVTLGDRNRGPASSKRATYPRHLPGLIRRLRRLLYCFALVARGFGDGDRRGSARFIFIVARVVSIAPLPETMRATVRQGDIHRRYPFVAFAQPCGTVPPYWSDHAGDVASAVPLVTRGLEVNCVHSAARHRRCTCSGSSATIASVVISPI
jgi:hypothetical protein